MKYSQDESYLGCNVHERCNDMMKRFSHKIELLLCNPYYICTCRNFFTFQECNSLLSISDMLVSGDDLDSLFRQILANCSSYPTSCPYSSNNKCKWYNYNKLFHFAAQTSDKGDFSSHGIHFKTVNYYSKYFLSRYYHQLLIKSHDELFSIWVLIFGVKKYGFNVESPILYRCSLEKGRLNDRVC